MPDEKSCGKLPGNWDWGGGGIEDMQVFIWKIRILHLDQGVKKWKPL